MASNIKTKMLQKAKYIFPAILIVAIISIFFFRAQDKYDHTSHITKHYNGPDWNYGGWANSLIKVKNHYAFYNIGNYVFYNQEGLPNYYNIGALGETNSFSTREYSVNGWPATERLISSVLYYLALHIRKINIQSLTLAISTLVWLVAIFCAYKLSKIWFEDRHSPWIAAILVTITPVFIINFSNIKFQQIGGVFFIFGVYLFEWLIVKLNKGYIYSALLFVSLFFLGFFSMGGGLLLWAYIMCRYVLLGAKTHWKMIFLTTFCLIAAKAWMNYLTSVYNLPSVGAQMKMDFFKMASETYAWLRTYVSAGNIDELKFIGYPGLNFFKYLIPLLGYGMFINNFPVLLLTVGTVFCDRKTRSLALTAVGIFFLGHAGTIATGWTNYYDYASLPATLLFSILAARFLACIIGKYPKFILGVTIICLLAIPLRINSYAFHTEAYLLFNWNGTRATLQFFPKKYIFVHWDNGNDFAY